MFPPKIKIINCINEKKTKCELDVNFTENIEVINVKWKFFDFNLKTYKNKLLAHSTDQFGVKEFRVHNSVSLRYPPIHMVDADCYSRSSAPFKATVHCFMYQLLQFCVQRRNVMDNVSGKKLNGVIQVGWEKYIYRLKCL